MMDQFRTYRNQYGNLYIYEFVHTLYGWTWREVCLRQFDSRTGRWS